MTVAGTGGWTRLGEVEETKGKNTEANEKEGERRKTICRDRDQLCCRRWEKKWHTARLVTGRHREGGAFLPRENGTARKRGVPTGRRRAEERRR